LTNAAVAIARQRLDRGPRVPTSPRKTLLYVDVSLTDLQRESHLARYKSKHLAPQPKPHPHTYARARMALVGPCDVPNVVVVITQWQVRSGWATLPSSANTACCSNGRPAAWMPGIYWNSRVNSKAIESNLGVESD